MATCAFSDFIECDLQDIAHYFGEREPAVGERFIHQFIKTARFLADNPYLGTRRSQSRYPDLRFWRVDHFPRHLIFYQPAPDGVQIVRVVHGSRDLHALLD